MKKSKWGIPIVLIVLTIGIFIWNSIPESITIQDKEQREAIEALQRENKVLFETNQNLDLELKTLEKKTSELQAVIEKGQDSIEWIKERKDENIDTIRDYTHDELYEFFAGFKTKASSD